MHNSVHEMQIACVPCPKTCAVVQEGTGRDGGKEKSVMNVQRKAHSLECGTLHTWSWGKV